VSDRNLYGDPEVRLMDGQTVVAVFACWRGQWLELGRSSKAEQRRIAHRHAELKQLSGRAHQERFAKYDREDTRCLFMRRPRHYVQLIGDEPFDSGGRRDRDGVPLEKIPGYREGFDFGRGRAFRAETFYQTLDAIRDADIGEVQLDAFKRVYERIKAQSC
jgi:hypothetical protein